MVRPIYRCWLGNLIHPAVLGVTLMLIGVWFSTPRTRWLLVNSLALAAAAAVLAVPAALLVVFALRQVHARARRISLLVLAGLLLVPLYIQTAAWDAFLGTRGWAAGWLPDIGSPGGALLTGWCGAIWVHAVAAIPWVVWILVSGVRGGPAYEEQAALLRARPAIVFLRITLPALRPFLLASLIWIVVVTTTEIVVTDVYQVRTFAEEVYTGFALGDQLSGVQIRLAPGLLLLAGLYLLIAPLAWVMHRPLRETADTPAAATPVGSTAGFHGVLLVVALWLVLVPVASLVVNAGTYVQAVNEQLVRKWSFGKVMTMIGSSPGYFLDEVCWSLVIGAMAAATAVAAALLVAWPAYDRGVPNILGAGLALVGLVVPGPVLALAITNWLNHPDSPWRQYLYDQTVFAPWLVLVIRAFPVAYCLTVGGLNAVDPRLLQLARLDGAGPVQRLCHIAIPLLVRPLVCAWLIALAYGMGELSGSILAVPPGVSTLAIRVFNLVHYGVDDRVAGICLAQLIFLWGIGAIVVRLGKQETGQKGFHPDRLLEPLNR